MSEKNTEFFLNGKPVPLFSLSSLLKGYNPAKEDDIWDEKETQWQKLTFADKIELARRFSCFEAHDLRTNGSKDGWKYFRKGAQRGLRIANIHDTDINHILDLVRAMIFVPDEMELAEQSSSYREWQDRIKATCSE